MTTLNVTFPRVEMTGRYRLQVRRAGELVQDTGWFDNLITDAGLEALGEDKAIGQYCSVGTSNTAPSNSDTTLGSHLANTTTVSATSRGVNTSGTRYGYETRSYQFAQGAVIGNVAEVGIGWLSGGSGLFSRSLVSPVLPLLAIDQLTVTYELRIYPPTTSTTGAVTIGSTIYNYTLKAMNAASNGEARLGGWAPELLGMSASARNWFNNPGSAVAFAWVNPAIIDQITDANPRVSAGGADAAAATNPSQNSSYSNAAYGAGNKYGQGTVTWGTGNGNGNLRAFRFSTIFGTFGMHIDADIVKDNTKELTMTWRVSWARRP